jgi:ribosome maturation factor RimP
LSKKSDTEIRVTDIITPVIEDIGYELVYVKFLAERGRPVLRIFIDKPGGVGVDDCALVSREIETVLEVEDVVNSSFALEVSSPGLDRPLFKPQDYMRFTGSLVKIRLSEPLSGQKVIRGRIQSATEEGFGLLAEEHGGEIIINYSQVEKANLEIEF